MDEKTDKLQRAASETNMVSTICTACKGVRLFTTLWASLNTSPEPGKQASLQSSFIKMQLQQLPIKPTTS